MKKIYIGLLGLCMLLGLNSCVKVNAAPTPSNGYSIQRVYFDPILNFRIYKVKTPTGTFEVMWEADKGGLCVLQRV
jgi:hypothetical protein